MAVSKAATVDAYLAELPAERREVIAAVLDLVRRHVPAGYAEVMAWGMPGWVVPLDRYPKTYNKQPLSYLGLAAQKGYYALYLNCVYTDSAQEQALRDDYAARGRKLDMGKCCLRFKSLEELPLELLGRIIAGTSVEQFIAQYEAARAQA